jgi:hypothetical protein
VSLLLQAKLLHQPPRYRRRAGPASALLLAGTKQADHLGDTCLARLRALSTLDPAQVAAAIEGRERLEEGACLGRGIQRRGDIRRKRVRLRPLRGELDLDLRAGLEISAPRQLQPLIAPVRWWRCFTPHTSSGLNGSTMNVLPPVLVTMAVKRCIVMEDPHRIN